MCNKYLCVDHISDAFHVGKSYKAIKITIATIRQSQRQARNFKAKAWRSSNCQVMCSIIYVSKCRCCATAKVKIMYWDLVGRFDSRCRIWLLSGNFGSKKHQSKYQYFVRHLILMAKSNIWHMPTTWRHDNTLLIILTLLLLRGGSLYLLGDKHNMRTYSIGTCIKLVFKCAFCFRSRMYPSMRKTRAPQEI